MRLPGELLASFNCGAAPFIDVSRQIHQIHQMNAPLSFLACLNPNDRQCNVSAESLAQQLVDREVPEKIAAYLVD
jgi:hypothetical protein